MAHPWHQANDDERQNQDRCRGEDVGELLSLTEGSAGVAQEPQSEQAAEEPNRKLGIEASDDDGLRDPRQQPGRSP